MHLGWAYVNDFPNAGRMQRVMIQADAEERMNAQDLLKLTVRNANGGMAPLSAFASIGWLKGPSQIVGYKRLLKLSSLTQTLFLAPAPWKPAKVMIANLLLDLDKWGGRCGRSELPLWLTCGRG